MPEILSLRSISDEAALQKLDPEADDAERNISFPVQRTRRQSLFMRMYYEFEEARSNRLAGHRTLALNRGEKEKFLTVKVEAPQEDILTVSGKERLSVAENPVVQHRILQREQSKTATSDSSHRQSSARSEVN